MRKLLLCVTTILFCSFAGNDMAHAAPSPQLQPPTITLINPNNVGVGGLLRSGLSGSNFATGMTVSAGEGITVTSVSVVSPANAVINLQVSPSAVLGIRDLTVTTTAGTSSSVPFEVRELRPPTLTSISPAAGSIGTSTTVTLNGTEFASGMTVTAGSGITFGNVSFSIFPITTVPITISPSATPGPREVRVTTAAGMSNSFLFLVTQPPPPAINTIFPTEGMAGTSVVVTLIGTNFLFPVTINPGPGITIPSTSFGSSILTVTLAISPLAPTGDRNITVTTPGGTSAPVVFTVVSPTSPRLSAITPNSGTAGSSVSVTLTGTNFAPGMTIAAGNGITVTNTQVSSSTSATATFTIGGSAAVGNRSVSVTTPSGTSGSIVFAVTPDQFLKTGYVIVTALSGIPAEGLSVTETFGLKRPDGSSSLVGVLPSPMTTFASLFVLIDSPSGRDVGLAMANPGIFDARVTFLLRRADGSLAATKDLTIAGRAQTASYVSSMFPELAANFVNFSGSLTILSDNPISMVGLRARGADFSTIQATNLSAATSVPIVSSGVGGLDSVILPQFAQDGGWVTEISVINTGMSTLNVRIDFFDNKGLPARLTMNGNNASSFNLTVPPNGVSSLVGTGGPP